MRVRNRMFSGIVTLLVSAAALLYLGSHTLRMTDRVDTDRRMRPEAEVSAAIWTR